MIFSLGRSDYGVDPETVDMRPTLDIRGLDQYETERSRQYAYFVRNAHHIRIIADVYHKIKKQKDWGADPRFVQKNPLFDDWLHNLPTDLQVNYPSDGAPPWIPSHFVGNMHCHCHLAIILLHRPQLVASQSFTAGSDWKIHFSMCYTSAKSICRLQEAILERFGLSGLLYMQRGINFAIYCILTCTMLHLVSGPQSKNRVFWKELSDPYRSQSLHQTRISTQTPENISHATCASWKDAPQPGPCKRSRHRSIPSDWPFPRILIDRLS
jgi:hypothetical protein